LLVAAAERKCSWASTEGTPDHFEKLLERPCQNHTFPVKHRYKDCTLMKWFLSRGPKKGDNRRKPEPTADDAKEKYDGFPMTDGCS
jgi:hypothetical protein